MANTLMFEVGIKRANEEYNKILEEVKALAKMADNSISLKVQLEKSNDLKTFLDALKQLGDGKMLEPLLHKIDNLQASMVRLGMIPKDIDYSNLEKQLQKVTVAYENYQKAREKAGLKEGQADVTGPTMALGQVYRTARANLEKEFGLSENVARATMDTFKNMGNTIQENMARIGGSKAGMESLSGEVGGLTTKVDALVNAFSSLVSQLKSLGTGSGVKDMATDVAKVDEGTSKMAQALAKAFGNLNEKKADVKVSEDSLATATNTAAAALKAEEAQAQATAASILRVADSISVATLATKNLYTILGGNREDIAKFLELANTMDMLSRKSAYIMSSGESFSGGKMGAFTEVKKEMEAVQAQMDELKKSGLSGSPIIDSFATAFENLSKVLTAAGTSVKESTKNLKSLGEGAKNLEKVAGAQPKTTRSTDEGTASVNAQSQAYQQLVQRLQEVEARLKVLAPLFEKVRSSQDKTAASRSSYLDWWKQQEQATKAIIDSSKVSDKMKQSILSSQTILADAYAGNKKVIELAEAMTKLDVLRKFSGADGNSGISQIRKEIEGLNEAIAKHKNMLVKGSVPTDQVDYERRIVRALEYRLSLMKELEQQGAKVQKTANYKPRGYDTEEHLSLLNERKSLLEQIEKLKKSGVATTNETAAAETKATSATHTENDAIQKLLTSTQELTTATNNLKMAIGSWGQDKGTIATMVAQFEELRKKITQVVEQWEKLAMVKATGVQNVQVPSFNIDLSSIEPTIKTLNEAVAQLKKSMDLLWESTNRMESSLKAIVTPETFKKVESDAASAKQKVDELSKSVEGMKMQSEKKGSETTLNANLDVLKNHTKNVYEALTQISVEYEKLSNQKLRDDGLEQRLLKLREYYEWLQKVATMTDTLSKPGALKADATKFNGELLMGKQTKEMWSDKAVKDFQKIVEEILSGRRAAESFETAIQKLKERVEEFNSTGSKGFGGVGAAMETINRVGELNIQTLIKEQAHIERMMKLAEGSSKYMEGHKVAGMDKLQAVQDSNMNYLQTLNRWISLILQNRDNPDIIRFLNTPQSLKLPLPGRADDVAMFNAHYDKLKHSITDTSAAARQLVKDMSLTDANASIKQWNTTRLETGLYNVQDAIQGIMRAWRNASQYADEDMTKAVAQQINRLNAIKQEILTAMTNEQLLGTRHGYASVINPDNTHTLKDSKQMVTDLNAFTRERIKAEKEYNKEVERFTNQSKKEAARQEQEYQKNVERWQESQMKTYAKAEQEKAKAAIQAQKDIQKEIERTEAQMRKLDSAISRGSATPGRDMTILTDARSKLQGQLNLLKGMTPADMQNNVLVEKRIKNIRTLRDDTDALRKSEERLTTAQQQSNRRSDRVDDKRLKDEIKSVNDAYVKYNELGAKLNELQALRARGITANVDVSGLDRYIEYLEKVRQLMKEIYSNNGRTSNSATVQDFGIRQGMLASEALAHNNVKSSSFYNKNNLSQFTQDLRDAESRMKAAQRTAENLGNRIDKLNLVKVDFAKAGIDTTPLQNAIDKIRAIQQELANFGRTGFSSYGISGKEIASNMGLNAANKAATDSIKNLTTEQRESANAANKMTIEQERLANALNKTSESAKGQSQVLSDLKMMAMQYISVWGAQSFISNIIEIGGQLEMQRLSIGAILQDTAHANELFEQIKTQALKSPFGVVELDAMTKQLSAYGFQYNELFEMTNRLANISAATGTSVDRLALALGHVRSEAALSGYTLRQFSMANIPLAKKLSEHLSEVEKRFVSVAEVRQRVRKKEIGYEDVVNVLKELTDEGGMFYNAQEIMSQSVKARFKNLRDAFDIMYGEIAESGIGDALKDVAGDLTVLAKNWKAFIPIIEAGAISFAAYRISLLAVNGAMGENAAATSRAIISYKQKRAEELQSDAIVRKLTADEMQLIQTRNQLTASNIRAAMSTGALTKADTLRLVGLQKISLRESVALMQMGLLTKEEIRAARAGSIMGLQMGKLGNQIKLLGASAASGVASIAKTIINPWTIGFAALSAGMSAWQRYQQRLDDMKTYRETLRTKSDEGTRNLSGELEKYGSIDVSKASADDLRTAISGIIEKLKDYDPSWQLSLKDAFSDEQTGKVRTQAEQFERLRTALNESAEAYKILKLTKDAFNNADDASGGAWYKLQERFSTNINDYNKDFEKYGKAASNLASNIDEVEQALNRAKGADKAFAEAVEGMNIREQIDVLMRNWLDYDNSGTNFGTAKNAFEESLGENGLVGTLNEAVARMDNLNRSWWALQESAIRFKERLYKDLVTNGGYDKNPANWTKGQNDAVLMEYKAFFEQFAKNVPENMRADIMKMMNGLRTDLTGGAPWRIPITFGVGETKQPLVGWRADMQQWLNENNLIFPITPEMSFEDIKKGIHGKIKELQEEADNSGGVLIGLGFKLNALPDEKPDGMAPWGGFNFDRYKQDKTQIKGFTDFLKAFNMPMPKEKKTGGNKEDKEAKRLREIAKLYKDAYDWYNKYEKQVGEAGALKKVQAQFQPLFDEFNKTWKTNLTLDSIPTYKQNLTELLDEAMKLYKTPKHKNSYMVEAIKQLRDAISNVDYEEANRKMDEFASKVKIQLDNLTRSWDLFNSVRESTGDVALANQLSGAKYKNGNTQNLADATRQKIEKDFEEAGGRYALEFDINLSDDVIQKLFEDTERWGVLESSVEKYQEKIKGLVEEYQKWRDLQRDVYKNDVQIFAKVTGSVMTYEAQLKRINDEYDREVAAITRLRDQRRNGEKDPNGNLLGITEEQFNAAKAKLDSDKEWKTFQMGAQYINFMNGAIGQTKKAIEDAAKAVENSLNKAVKKGTIDAKTYAEQMRKIRDIVDKFREDSFFGVQNTITAFMQGGLKGSNEFAKDRLQALETKEKNGGLTEDEEKEKKHLVDLQNKLSKVIGSLSSFATILQMATGVADGLVNATQSLANMFQALGNTGAANFWGDLSDGIKAGTSFLAPANNIVQNAMSGNIGGVVSSVISSPIDMIAAPITGFAKLHDKRRERRIQELKEEVSRIANNTELILKTRQRTLGYDSGNLRQLYSNQYYHQENVDYASKLTGMMGAIIKGSRYGRGFNSAAEEAMYNYYQQNGEGSGYKQQLANLRSEREKYMQMYNEEEDKKDSSGEAMEEYKKKIAELDDQIHYFALDLANELWSIDMKGWAQQLTDALATAFENGTNMAKAYKKAVEDILRSLAGKMMQLAIIEPIMQKLQNKLFGTQNADGTWSGGVFDIDNPEKSAKQVTNIIAKFFGKGGEGEAAIKAGEVFLAEFERGVNQAGLSIKNKDESSLSGSIKSITEETADIIASYVNAIRADVAMNRMFITMFIQEYWASYIEQITSVHTTLRNIDRNVAAMALTFSEAGKIYGMIENISNRLDKFANGVDKISVQ